MRIASRHALVALCVGAILATTAAAQTLIVLNKSDATASLIDPATYKVVATLPTGAEPHEVAVSPDGRTAVVANYGYGKDDIPGKTLTVIDLKERRVQRTIDLGSYRAPHGITFVDDNRFVVTAEDSGALLLGDRRKARILKAFPTNAETSHMVVASRDGRRAYVASMGSGSITAIDLKTGKAREVKTGAGAEGIDLSPDGSALWVTNRDIDTVSILDPVTLELVEEVPSADFPIRVKVTPKGFALVSNYKSADISVFDVKTRKLVKRIPLQNAAKPIGILLDPDGKRAYVASTNANVVNVIDLTNWTVLRQLPLGNTPDGMAISVTH